MKHIIKKLGTLIITLFTVSFLTFFVFQIIPGDSVVASLGTDATKEAVDSMREELGLNDPFLVRYGNWLSGVVKGDFGTSTKYHQPVSTLIKDRLPVTIWLAVLSLIIILLLSIPLGILSARKRGKLIEQIILILTQLTMAIPPFFLGIILTLIFGVVLKWFVPGQYISYSDNFAKFLGFIIFPAITIAIPKIAMMVRFLRSSLLRQLNLDYVRTAYSKGNKEKNVLYYHVLKNAFIPVITFLGMIIADVLAGSIIVEQVFSLPGLGRFLVVSISNRDFPVVQAIVMYIAVVVIVINFLIDILYQVIDPRIRIAK
ncbi:ABC transporter permease [Anaeromicropila herbilytica]|uniref:ABC transporter permease n=1 Tax=Anaeromicropila herbilytica TaxID=2785025 RepID=A0A7R7EPK0_9FIRM|nr:ABC transporter permease [Anaeromicropila herbilytica]BCN32431.1 ABC transporter permease [Anaeromicropila herbilytica]